MKIKTAILTVACLAAAALFVRPAAAQTDTATAAAPAATTPAATAPAAATPAARPRRNPNLITRAEIDARELKNALDAVRSLRGAWLRPSRAMSAVTDATPIVAVYRDGNLISGASGRPEAALREIPAESIATIEYLNPREAIQRYGSDYTGGAIMVNSH